MTELISHEVCGVGFGFYSSDEILRLSVKRVTVPHLFDQLGNPIPNGLYDPALGPLERFDSCQTCGLPANDCLGHLGHIQLSVPCYQPLLFDLTFKLLRAKCFVCHRLKMNRLKLKILVTKLRLVDAGLLVKAKLVDEIELVKLEEAGASKDKKKKGKKSQESDDDEMEEETPKSAFHSTEQKVISQLERLNELASKVSKHNLKKFGRAHELNSHENAFRNEQVRLFIRELTANKCSTCGAPSPTLRKDGHNKVFRLPLTKQQEQAMAMLGLKFDNVMGDQASKRDFLREYRAIQSFAKTQKNVQPSKSSAKDADSDSDSDSDSDVDQRSELSAQELEEAEGLKDMTDALNGPAVADSLETARDSRRMPILMFPSEVEKHLELLWDKEKEVFDTVWGSLAQFPSVRQRLTPSDYRIFFVRILTVPPSRFRPPTKFGDMTTEHPQNAYFRQILEIDQRIIKAQMARGENQLPDFNLLIESWLALQNEVNMLIDSSKGPNPAIAPTNGIRQTFEKKEGLFRKHMMGKRVNFAARSVISPDPFLNTNEIGVPEMFATQLTFPEPVTPYNINQLRAAVINGPEVHPGANYIEDERGQLINLATRSREQREALSRTLLTSQSSNLNLNALGIKRVLRHIRTGDVMLVNRQPTLHKPSMMSHKVRVLSGKTKMWQTIRMHYANCNTYNADFDGDEMNLHVPQNQLSRAEAYFISNTDNQYLVPTDGSPLRGLIQDNVLSGVLLTKLDTFLTKYTFQQLLFSCLDVPATSSIRTPLPTILKPVQLWSGKQVITSILEILTADRPKLNLNSNAKVPAASWGQHRGESTIIIRGNELCTGALDKFQFGDAGFGLVHAVFELYGPETAGRLLSILGRLFTIYLQTQGFTCGIDDMLLVDRAEQTRRNMIEQARVKGIEAAANFSEAQLEAPIAKKPDQTAVNAAIQTALKDPKNGARLDNAVKAVLNPFTGDIIKACLPSGQVKAFPENCMSLMTLSGAKGSNVNFSQISCCLGQQELEGRRVPLMPTGKSLPCFRKYDPAPIAGGYVSHRFLTGIPPSSYYFHAMAGREGLIDTAVKTSRSGYLQRCLIKHLESLCVQYDYTVRDSDSSVVQFHYGEDSIDIGKTAYLEDFSFLTSNYRALVHKLNPVAAVKAVNTEEAIKYLEKQKSKKSSASDPVMNHFNPGRFLGCVSDAYQESMENYIKADKDGWFSQKNSPITPDKFRALMRLNYLFSLVHPGESVGILAAQSIGEPSTQMTLNTFHLAGHGGANVTLGIPRLREIIMTASQAIKTPICEVPLRPGVTREQAESIASRLNRIPLSHFIVEASSKESLEITNSGVGNRLYTIRLQFPPLNSKLVKSNQLSPEDFHRALTTQFALKLNAAIAKQVKLLSKSNANTPVIMKARESADEREAPKSRRRGADEDDAISSKEKAKKSESISYDEPDSDDEELIRQEESKRKRDEEEESEVESESETEKRKKPLNEAEEGTGIEEAEHAATGSRAFLSKCPYIRNFNYSTGPTHYAEFLVGVQLSLPKLLMISEVENVVDLCLLRSTKGINKCVVLERKKKDTKTGEMELILQTDGINFQEMAKHSDLFDVTQLYSNDIYAIFKTYGVEAARAAITKEVNAVFGVYGISVDMRHLGLIADYMTFEGGYRPLNRGGIDSNTSTFQKVSFETSLNFLKDACLLGDFDTCASPSSNLVIGKPPKCGTGLFQLLQPLFSA